MHAEKRAGPGGQNNGGTFPGSQANSDSSQPVTTALSFPNHPSLYSLNENNDIIVLGTGLSIIYKLCHPAILDRKTCSNLGKHGEHGEHREHENDGKHPPGEKSLFLFNS